MRTNRWVGEENSKSSNPIKIGTESETLAQNLIASRTGFSVVDG